jgi:hypothetical protein
VVAAVAVAAAAASAAVVLGIHELFSLIVYFTCFIFLVCTFNVISTRVRQN